MCFLLFTCYLIERAPRHQLEYKIPFLFIFLFILQPELLYEVHNVFMTERAVEADLGGGGGRRGGGGGVAGAGGEKSLLYRLSPQPPP